jgi:hypothetical protein
MQQQRMGKLHQSSLNQKSLQSRQQDYVRTISSSEDLDQEISSYGSDDEVAVLDETGLNSVFAEITSAKLSSNLKVDVQLAPMILNRCAVAVRSL